MQKQASEQTERKDWGTLGACRGGGVSNQLLTVSLSHFYTPAPVTRVSLSSTQNNANVSCHSSQEVHQWWHHSRYCLIVTQPEKSLHRICKPQKILLLATEALSSCHCVWGIFYCHRVWYVLASIMSSLMICGAMLHVGSSYLSYNTCWSPMASPFKLSG